MKWEDNSWIATGPRRAFRVILQVVRHPYILNPTPYTLHRTPYTLHTTPHTLHPTAMGLRRAFRVILQVFINTIHMLNPMHMYTKPCIYIHKAPGVPSRAAGPSAPLIGHQTPVRISVGMSPCPYGLPIVAVGEVMGKCFCRLVRVGVWRPRWRTVRGSPRV